ncbi:MAG: hypothetical protein UT50_C0002G0009 [Candidatus Moranbacteria bacterium GW2011_GWA2_39_41]|nr:MAG: hypothetical protein UT50_C0002G0009 [Candidatus Moranbacteria bacterium GW2011_GWA2_39_41]
MLVIAIVLTVGFLSSAYPLRLISRMAMRNSSDEVRGMLWKAQSYAMSGRQHSAWGVHYENSIVAVFKGNDYNNRNQSFDEKISIDERVSIAGFPDAIFVVPDGRPQAPISNITFTCDDLTDTLSLNAEGVIE